MSKILFSSDFHGFHKNITGPKISSWSSGYRDFNSIEEMNESIINSINSNAKPNDILYYLGDWTFGGEQNIPKFRSRINIGTIHFIKGNHDTYIDKYKNLFNSVQDYLEISINGQFIVLGHYPIYEWNKCHRGSWMLCGHSHGKCEYSNPKTSQYKCLDIGWDIFRKPLDFSEIKAIMSKKVVKGHHETNRR